MSKGWTLGRKVSSDIVRGVFLFLIATVVIGKNVQQNTVYMNNSIILTVNARKCSI
ncbi:hypothetical protein GCM10023116_17270 [Kistimonas scapharcae]|uniref:Uncharacterized protein n=1 Tax=Kistimonas scapharcae TaxID=1036133 RepID=A0ABP8UZU0_9GAMM